MNKKLFLSVLSILIIALSAVHLNAYDYPRTHKSDVVDSYHGISVADPYRWLEDQNLEETKQWVFVQQSLTEQFLNNCPAREKIKERLTGLWNYAKHSMPTKIKECYFYWKNDGLQNQSVLYRAKNLTDTPEIVIDPNRLSDDGTISIQGTALSDDGSILAYSVSVHGSDWKELKFIDCATGKEYPDKLTGCKHTVFSWKHDNSGIYYNRFLLEEGYEDGVYWHALGTDQSQDILVYKNQLKEQVNCPLVTEDGKYLLFVAYRAQKNGISFRPIDSQEPFTTIFGAFDNQYEFVGNVGSMFYFRTDNAASRGRLIAVDVSKDVTRWQTIIPESHDNFSSVGIVNNKLVCHYMHDAQSVLSVHALDGSLLNTIPLPTVGSAGCSGKQESDELFVTFASFLYPSAVYRYDFTSNALTQVWDVGIAFDFDVYETKQVFYQSADGATVPMFITHKKGMALDGNNPVDLYGYGGFDISLPPFFSLAVLAWLEQGGVLAVANIRGGGEYGKEWHEAAMLEKRQTAFNDFIAAGEWLIKNNYTNPRKLAITGGSNGGLLVATCMLQRPDLFGAVVSHVPVTDMLRFQLFTSGHYWVCEYGDISKVDDFKALYAYSPLHNVRDGVVYPPIMVTSADTDDRVVPSHSKKFVARLQEASSGENLILLRYESNAGHGAGTPTSKRIDEKADEYAFLMKALGMEFKR